MAARRMGAGNLDEELHGGAQERLGGEDRARRPGRQPRPMNGILVAITVMNWTLASSGSPAM